MKTNSRIFWIAALLALASGASLAGSVGPITTFTSGTTAVASEVNGNFSAVSTAVNDNNARIGTLEGVSAAARLSTLETTVTGGNIVLAYPSTAATGNILKGTVPFIHNFGADNTFIGVNAGNFTMTGARNTASGINALLNNTTGASNTASGMNALHGNTTGASNTASGRAALGSNTTGGSNTAAGRSALEFNTTGGSNTASGVNALFFNTTGSVNTANGVGALQSNTTGFNNTANGAGALINNTTGNANIAIGINAGLLLTVGDDNIVIGNPGVAGESATTRIGSSAQTRTFIRGIRGVTTGFADAISVVIDSGGQLGTFSSSRRVKDDIADMGEGSSVLMKLRPVTFYYKADKNPKGRTLQYGLVAEEVAKVAPGLVARSADGSIETVYYQHLAPMLLNEYQKQQRIIDAQAAALKQQAARTAELEQERRMQTARIETLERQAARMAVVLGRLEQAGMIATAGR